MIYFNSGYIEFLEQLSQNNNKDWFRENKKWYELAVREPFKNLLDDLIPKINEIEPDILMEPKDALFRINRDMRFSKYKLPYKTHMAAGFSKGGRKSEFAGYYLQIGRKHIAIGGGLPYLEREVLRKIRMEIGFKLDTFNSLINAPNFKSIYGTILGETDRDLPKTFVNISEEHPIIAKKQLYYSAFYRTEELLFDEGLIDIIIAHFEAGSELNSFLTKAISNFSRPIKHTSRSKTLEF